MPKPKTDEAFLARLKRHMPEVHEAKVNFDAALSKIVRADPEKSNLRQPRKRKRQQKSR